MAASLLLFLLILSSVFTFTSQNQQHERHHLISELTDAKDKIAQLEYVLEETVQKINAKSNFIEEREKRIDDLENKLHDLQYIISQIKDSSTHAEERIIALEEEVRFLWAVLRQNNFDLHILESKAQDAEDRLEVVSSKVEEMAAIVNEQWIQIQHLEQALHMAELRALNIQRKLRPTRCTFLKFINNLSGEHLPKLFGMFDSYLSGRGSTLNSYMSQSQQRFKRFFSAFKKFHYEVNSFPFLAHKILKYCPESNLSFLDGEKLAFFTYYGVSFPFISALQGLIKQEMEKNKLTAALVNEELVFFVASALITFPILTAWILLSSQFS